MAATKKTAFGIDIGGSGIKGAPVDLKTGQLTAERHRIPTPSPSTPDRVADVVAEVLEHFKWTGPVGITFPAVVQHGVTRSAANVDQSWLDADADSIFEKRLGAPWITSARSASDCSVRGPRFSSRRSEAKSRNSRS